MVRINQAIARDGLKNASWIDATDSVVVAIGEVEHCRPDRHPVHPRSHPEKEARRAPIFDGRKLHVERALSAGRIESTKTGEPRTVDMSQQLAALLRDFLVWREKRTLRLALSQIPEWLFFNDAGLPLDESRVIKHFRRVSKEAGVLGFKGPYDLRHTFATLLLSKGVPLTYVAAQLCLRCGTIGS